ncbi:MAG: hypothetical protein JEY79_19235 [Pseudodesulfovibrio sp.]|nr:hypothetical protein [Pseudodesulfovibrio sp.]
MTRQVSFSKIRNETMHEFREKMNQAESTEDVKKFYADTMQSMLNKILGRDESVRYEDVSLSPSSSDGYVVVETLRDRPLFKSAWGESDLSNIINDFTQIALKKYVHLQKNPEKTRSKIHHVDGKR